MSAENICLKSGGGHALIAERNIFLWKSNISIREAAAGLTESAILRCPAVHVMRKKAINP